VEMAQTATRKPECSQRDFYANFVWMMSGFSCHSSFSTHICVLLLALPAQVIMGMQDLPF
jgi:hypothetical protein